MFSLSRHLRFQPAHTDFAQERLRDSASRLARRLGEAAPPVEELVFVGIHNRRTDFKQYHRSKVAGLEELQEEYFQDAMEEYR